MTLLLIPGPVRSALRRSRALRRKLAGVGFLVVVAGLIATSIAVYNKAFTPVVPVTIRAAAAGLQLDVPADVAMDGVVVGHVRGVTSNGRVATLQVALNPADTALIPSNVTAMILPETLFGEKYVQLVAPASPSATPIAAHAVIGQDETKTAIETGRVFTDLVPLLKAVQPVKLDATLTAIATALSGKGNALGHNLVLADRYFTGLDPHLATIDSDLAAFANVAGDYANVAPNLLALAANFSATSLTLTQNSNALSAFLAGTAGFANTATTVLTQNASDLISLAGVGVPIFRVLSYFSPQISYILQAEAQLAPRLNQVLGGEGPFLHIKLYVVPQATPYTLGVDCPEYSGPFYPTARGPNCPGGAYYPSVSPAPSGGGGAGSGTAGTAAGGGAAVSPAEMAALDGTGPVGTPAEQAIVAVALAPQLGVPAAQVPSVADLLAGPILRGETVAFS